MTEKQPAREWFKWRDVFAHKSTMTCDRCRHFTPRQRFCERGKFLTQSKATCRQFSKPRKQL